MHPKDWSPSSRRGRRHPGASERVVKSVTDEGERTAWYRAEGVYAMIVGTREVRC